MTLPRYPEYKESGVAWLGEVPATWELKRLGFFFDERREKVSDKDFCALSVTKNGIVPQIETAAKTDDGDNRKKVCAGDFVINSRSDRKGSSGISSLEGSVSLINTVLRPRAEVAHGYVHQLLRSQPFQEEFYRYGKGIVADLWSTNYSEMSNITLAVPSLCEQSNIATFLDCETAKIDGLIAEQETLIALLAEKRLATISHAVTKGLNRDASTKDSGVAWLGDVPTHWRCVPLKHLGNIRYGIGEPPRYRDEGTPLIRATNVHAGKIYAEGLVFVSPDDIPSQRIVWLQDGDIIVVRSGAYTGDSALVNNEYAGTIAGFDMVLRLHSALPAFVSYTLLSQAVKTHQIDLKKMRAAQPHLNAEELGECLVALPPAEEQKLIVRFLDDEAARLDALTAEATRGIALLKERRSALISAAVTGKIDVRHLAEAEAA